MNDLTKEEKEFIYYQLSARKLFFEEDMVDAASNKNINRITECNNALTTIRVIQNKLF
ncbi:hypothetical protein ACH6EH_07310 [Paenibacillus sp. JSM ZJ436]|uniref:hypothetical protein n=1 Tax=Paenibacillus sp. JSM ZJ436 TaxID=3376190 RepID=UPI0037B54BE1